MILSTAESNFEHRPTHAHPLHTSHTSHTSGVKTHTQSNKMTVGLMSSVADVPTSATSTTSQTTAAPIMGPRLSIQHAGGSAAKSKVPPPVPPRGSPRRKKSDGHNEVARAISNTGTYSIGNKNKNKKNNRQTDTVHLPVESSLPTPISTVKTVKPKQNKFLDATTSSTLKVEERPLPRFGERRSPSNVQDWLELHDLFDIDLPPPIPPPPQLSAKALNRVPPSRPVKSPESVHSPMINRKTCRSIAPSESVKSTYSTARSEVRSHKSYRYNLLHRVDMFQRQNSIISRHGRPSIGSIVYNFPPIEPEPPELPLSNTNDNAKSFRRSQQKSNKHQRMFQYADMALRDERLEDEHEENLLQSVNAFVEVKKEIESKFKPRKSRPPPAIPITADSPNGNTEVSTAQKRGRQGAR